MPESSGERVEEVIKGLRGLKQASLAFVLIYVVLIIGFIIAVMIVIASSVGALTGVRPSQEEVARIGEEVIRRLLSAALIMSLVGVGANLVVVLVKLLPGLGKLRALGPGFAEAYMLAAVGIVSGLTVSAASTIIGFSAFSTLRWEDIARLMQSGILELPSGEMTLLKALGAAASALTLVGRTGILTACIGLHKKFNNAVYIAAGALTLINPVTTLINSLRPQQGLQWASILELAAWILLFTAARSTLNTLEQHRAAQI